MRFRYAICALLIAMLQPQARAAEEQGPARAALERFATGLESFQADFEQVVMSQDGRINETSEGHVWLQHPDKLRWIYTGDFPETIVADGDNVWIHDESLEQVTIKPQSAQSSNSPLMILADVSRIDEAFEATELGDTGDMLLLELRSTDAESEFERILIGLGDGDVKVMAMEDAFGQRTEIRFENARRNAPLDPALFQFTVPEGADVVGEVSLPD